MKRLYHFLLFALVLTVFSSFVPENDPEAAVKVYPNPATEFISIHYERSGKHFDRIRIIDLTGKSVKNLSDQNLVTSGVQIERADISDLPPGVYFIRLKAEQETKSLKLVVH